ncbi:MAG: hypothetical protein ACC608_08070 [Anaerofustis sp.]
MDCDGGAEEDAGADDAADAEGHQSERAEFIAVCGFLLLRCHASLLGWLLGL